MASVVVFNLDMNDACRGKQCVPHRARRGLGGAGDGLDEALVVALALLGLREGVQGHLGDVILGIIGVMMDEEDITQRVAERRRQQEAQRRQPLIGVVGGQEDDAGDVAVVLADGHQGVKGAIDGRWRVVPSVWAVIGLCWAGERDGGAHIGQHLIPLRGELADDHEDIAWCQRDVGLMLGHGPVLELMAALLPIKCDALRSPAKL